MCNATKFALGPGVSFCVTDGRAIFLDLIADRYLCLGEAEGRAFDHLVAGGDLTLLETAHIETLVERGLLVPREEAQRPTPCSIALPVEATVRSTARAPSAITQFHFAWHVMSARRRLKRYGLYKTVQTFHLHRRKPIPTEVGSLQKLREATDLLVHIGRYMTRFDQCLPISLGLATYLQGSATACNVVMGVQLGPFQAHCWVQRDGLLVGDDLDIVRTFTPILVI